MGPAVVLEFRFNHCYGGIRYEREWTVKFIELHVFGEDGKAMLSSINPTLVFCVSEVDDAVVGCHVYTAQGGKFLPVEEARGVVVKMLNETYRPVMPDLSKMGAPGGGLVTATPLIGGTLR